MAAHRAWETSPEILLRKRERKRERYHSDQAFRKKVCAIAKKWRVKNPDKFKAGTSKWRLKHKNDPVFKERACLSAKRRRERIGGRQTAKCAAVRILGTTTCYSSLQIKKLIETIYERSVAMTKRYGTAFHVDHIIPVHHGGQHAIGNLQILDGRTNGMKGHNPFWMSLDGLSLDWRDVPRDMWPENLRPEYERLIALHPKPVHAIRKRLCRG